MEAKTMQAVFFKKRLFFHSIQEPLLLKKHYFPFFVSALPPAHSFSQPGKLHL